MNRLKTPALFACIGLMTLSGAAAMAQSEVASTEMSREFEIQAISRQQPSPLQQQALQLLSYDTSTSCSLKKKALTPLPNPLGVHLRLGLMLSPRTGFAPGVDATIPGLHLFPGFTSRVDLDYIITSEPDILSFNFKSFIPVTFNQVYSKGLLAGNRIYGGFGVGPYFGEVTRFGGKLFVGADLFNSFGLELGVHFAGVPDPLVTLQARVKL